jgi:hypothetical protein
MKLEVVFGSISGFPFEEVFLAYRHPVLKDK